MAVVGDAYIVVKAITSGFERDVRRSLNGINLNADGASIGESFTKGFNNSMAKGLGQKFNFSAGEASAAREVFQSLVRTNYVLTASIGPLISSLGSLGGGFISLVSILGAATPALVVLPGLLAAIGLGAATTMAALSGVSKAVSAGMAKQAKTTKEDTTAKIAAARRVEDAQARLDELDRDAARLKRDRLKDVTEAENDRAKVAEDNAKREAEAIADLAAAAAEGAQKEEEADKRLSLVKEKNTEAMIDANNRLKEAQLELTKALESGREEIQQLGFDAEDAALSEKRASITLEKARETLQRTQDLPPNSRARREAQLAFAEAELGLRRAKDKNKDLQKEQDKLAGDPKNTAGYINALQKQEDAQASVAEVSRDALRAQTEAEQNLAAIRKENADKLLAAEQKIADVKTANAQKLNDAEAKIADVKQKYLDREEDLASRIAAATIDLTRATEDQTKANEGGAAAVDAYAQALDGLSPAAQEFVKYLVGTFMPALKELRDAAAGALLPLITTGLEKLRTVLFPVLKPLLEELGTSVGNAFNTVIDSIVDPENIADLKTVFGQAGYVLEGLGKTVAAVYDSILSILVAADPVIRKFTDFLAKKSGEFAEFLDTAQANGDLEAFFTKAGEIAAKLGTIFGNTFSIISNLIGANFEPGGGGYIFLDWLTKVTDKFEKFSGSVEGKDSLAEYFKGAATNSIAILESVGAFVKEILKVGADPNVKVFWDTLKDGAPIFGDILKSATDSGPALANIIVSMLKFAKATTDAGAIKIFFDTLNVVLTAINTLLENKFVKAVFNATGKILAFGLALGTIGKVGGFGMKVVAGNLESIGKMVTAIVPAPVLASVKSGLETIALKGMYAFDKVKAGAASAGSKVLQMAKTALPAAGAAIRSFATASLVLLTNPIFLITAAVVAIIASLVLLYHKVDWFKEGVDKAFGAVKDAIMGAFNWLKENWPLVLAIITGPFGLAVLAIVKHWDEIVAFVKGIPAKIAEVAGNLWGWVSDTFTTAYDNIKTTFTAVVGWVKGLPGEIAKVASNLWGWVSDKFTAAYDSVKTTFATLVTWVKGLPAAIALVAGNLWGWISDKFTSAYNAVKTTFATMVTWVTGLPARITTAAAGLWDGFKNGFKEALNWIIRKWNSFRIDARIPENTFTTLLGVANKGFTLDTPNIPELALGGIVSPSSGGTIARIAEAGKPERVEPLDPQGLSKRDRAMIELLSGGSGGNTINVYPSQGMNESELASIISRQIAFQLRRGGA